MRILEQVTDLLSNSPESSPRFSPGNESTENMFYLLIKMDFQQPKPGKQLKTLLNITRYWRVVLSHCQGGVVVSICASHHNDLDSIPAWGICGVSFWLIPNDSMGFSPGTPAFLPPQNQLTANIKWLWCCAPWSHVDRVAAAREAPSHAFGPTSKSCVLAIQF